jgi:hypothetical protein
MAQIMVKCPVTNHAISTGLDVVSDADFNCLLNVAYHVDCPLCGGSHVWFKHDAWIAGRSSDSPSCEPSVRTPAGRS